MARHARTFAPRLHPEPERRVPVAPRADVVASGRDTPSLRAETASPPVNPRVAQLGPRFAAIPVHASAAARTPIQRSRTEGVRLAGKPDDRAIIQRKIESGKLNMVGENHNESGARRVDEKAMIKEKYGISEENYWTEDAFHYEADGETRYGDSLVYLVLQSASFLLADMKYLDSRVEAVLDHFDNGFTQLFDDGVAGIITKFDKINGELNELEAAVDRLADSADGKTNDDVVTGAERVVDQVRDGLDYYGPRLFKPVDALDREELMDDLSPLSVSVDSWRVAISTFLESSHYTPGDDPGAIEDQVTGERSLHMFLSAEEAATKGQKTGVWKIGEHHIKDMKGSETTATTITPQDQFNSEFAAWKQPKK